LFTLSISLHRSITDAGDGPGGGFLVVGPAEDDEEFTTSTSSESILNNIRIVVFYNERPGLLGLQSLDPAVVEEPFEVRFSLLLICDDLYFYYRVYFRTTVDHSLSHRCRTRYR
jgi:hypothetical protein